MAWRDRTPRRRSERRSLKLLLPAGIALAAFLAAPAGAEAARGFMLGLGDPVFRSDDRDVWLDRTADANTDTIRLNLPWRLVARNRPAVPSNHESAGYDFTPIDLGVIGARARGMKVMLSIQGLPGWAEGPNRDPGAPEGTWKPDPGEFADFMAALATRYSGEYGGIPRVHYIQMINEPNNSENLTPQWVGNKPVAAIHYRKMTAQAYQAVKDVNPAMTLVGGGTSPYGLPKGEHRPRPVQFWRSVFCLRGQNLRKAKCSKPGNRAHFDIMAHHPINSSGPPKQHAFHPDDASSNDLDRIMRVLRRAEKTNRIKPSGKRQLWATEAWWESNPPDRRQGETLNKQALYLSESIYLAWKAGASALFTLRIVDMELSPRPAIADGTGLYLIDETPKPALRSFRMPFYAERATSSKIYVWARLPDSGTAKLQKKTKRGWRKIKTIRVGSSGVISQRVGLRGKAKIRISFDGSSTITRRIKR